MDIGSFSLKNKYLILSLSIAIVIFGFYAKGTLKSQLSPDTNASTATVIVQYPGASAQDVVKDIIEPMEDQFGTLEGINNIKSTGQDNIASIQLKFNYGADIDKSAIDVQNSINRIRNKLPRNMMEPKVLKFSTSDKPVMTVSLSSDSVNLGDIRQLVEDKIKYDIQAVDGVAAINLFGGNIKEVRVELDKNKINAYGLSIEQVSKTLLQNNIKAPGGKIMDGNKEILIRVEEDFQDLEDIRNLRIPLADNNFVYLRDLAEVNQSIEELESAYRYNGEEAIALMITKKSDANTIDVIKSVNKELEKLTTAYPFVDFKISQDDSVFTTQMVDNMTSSVLLAVIFTILIIVLFISNISQSLVISISIPVVFLSTLGLMKAFDMKLDMVTLSALILSIGFVVDAAIVVVENIMTHYHDQGKDIMTAAIDGTKEIAMASLAGASTTLIVLVPLLFIKGFVGEMFRPLATTVIFAIGSSVIIALLIIPLLTVMFNKFEFKRTEKIIRIITVPFNRMMDGILNFYVVLLNHALKYKLLMFITIIGLMGLSIAFIANNGVEMLPKFDSGTSYVSIEMESGTTLKDTTNAINKIEKMLEKEKNVTGFDTQIGFEQDSNVISDFGIMGTNQAIIAINLNTRMERKETIWEFQKRLRNNIAQVPDIKRFVVKEKGGTAAGSSTAPIDVKISGADQKLLHSIASGLEEKLKQVEGTTNIYKSFNIDNLQLDIKMNNARMQELGLTSATASQQIYASIEGVKGSFINLDGADNIPISVEYLDKSKQTIDSLLDVYITTPTNLQVPLREFASIEVSKRANIITKENHGYTIDILGYTQDRAFSKIQKDIQLILEEDSFPAGYSAELSGESKDLGDSMADMIFLLAIAIVFVYLVLVPQFKSFVHPITIMASIPLVVIGIAPALGISRKFVSMPVLLGFILLAGTVVNNAILVIDQAIANQAKGSSLQDSVIAAVKSRFRPIMMTALSDVVGMLPLALQLALGSERFSPLAITVIGGMLAATFLTMLVIPVMYVAFEEAKKRVFLKQLVVEKI